MEPDPLIPAATIILLRDKPSAKETADFQALMIERHVNIGFAGGALVFPGGRVDPGDRNEAWAGYADGLPENSVLAAAMVAAIRESFEEAGILLATANGIMIDDERTRPLSAERDDVEADDSHFLDLIKREGLRLACDQLTLFAHWMPPKQATYKRFDTLFFVAKAPTGQTALEDGNEATEVLWISPEDALRARDNETRKMIFPTARNIELLGVSKTMDQVFTDAQKRKIECVQPCMVKRNGGTFITIPDDLGYPVIEEPLEKAFRQ